MEGFPLRDPPRPAMMDREERGFRPLPPVALGGLVPPDHFYRHLEAKLDLASVRDWTREFYTEWGRSSFDSVVFFELQLVMFFEGIRASRATPDC